MQQQNLKIMGWKSKGGACVGLDEVGIGESGKASSGYCFWCVYKWKLERWKAEVWLRKEGLSGRGASMSRDPGWETASCVEPSGRGQWGHGSCSPSPLPFRNLDFYPVSLYLGGDVHLSGTLPGNSKYIEILVVVKTNKMKLPMDLAAWELLLGLNGMKKFVLGWGMNGGRGSKNGGQRLYFWGVWMRKREEDAESKLVSVHTSRWKKVSQYWGEFSI